MAAFLLGSVVLTLAYFLALSFTSADPKRLAVLFRAISAGSFVLAAIGALLIGRLLVALLLGGAAWLIWTKGSLRFLGGRRGSPQPSQGMSRAEAYAVLGLRPGATDADIREAHRRLIQQNHPDHGGSDYLAAKINAAKDVLLG